MRYNKVRYVLLFWCLFIGIGALYGGSSMLMDPSGKLLHMDEMLPYFEVLPFSNILFKNYLFPGFSLIIVNGLSNISAAILLTRKKKLGIILGGTFGFTLMLWITIQFIIFPMNVLSISYFIFGLLQMITGYMCYVFYKQETYKIDESQYKNIGKNKKILTVYFSRMRYTKKIALEEANKTGSEVIELKTNERTNGTLGFWWCGRYGMHRWAMPITNSIENIEKYDKVIICCPIWVFGMAAPIREFCKKYSGKIKSTEYIFNHFMIAKFTFVANEMDKLLKIKRDKFESISTMLGKIVSRKEYK